VTEASSTIDVASSIVLQPLPASHHNVLAHLYWLLSRKKNSASDIMRIQSLLTSIALLASTVLAVEIVCTFAPMCLSSSFLLTKNYHEASVDDDGEFPDLPVEDPVLAVTASFPESNPFGRKFPALHYFLSSYEMSTDRCCKRRKQ
jgi:hypothetical protein